MCACSVVVCSAVVSVTVAVQLEAAPTGTVTGEQLTIVVVSCAVATTSAAPLEPRWLPSPAEEHTTEFQPHSDGVYRLLQEEDKKPVIGFVEETLNVELVA